MGKKATKIVGTALTVAGTILAFTPAAPIGAALIAIGGVINANQARLAAKKARALANKPQAVTGNIVSANEPLMIIFGRTRVGGVVFGLGTRGARNENLDILIAHGLTHAGGINNVTGIYLNDVRQTTIAQVALVSDAGGANETRGVYTEVTGGDASGAVGIKTYFGLHTQLPDSELVGYGLQNNTDYARGIAWSWVRLTRNLGNDAAFQRAFPQGIPTVSLEIAGLLCYDPRLDSTRGGSGAQRTSNPRTWTWTNNTALCAATYRIMRALDGGCGGDPEKVNWLSVAAAANVCDVNIESGTGTKRYTCNLALSSADSRDDNMEAIVACMSGQQWEEGGIWNLRAGSYDSPTAVITDDWLAGPVTVTNGFGLDGLYNAVRTTYSRPDAGYQMTEAYPFTNASYDTEDGGRLPSRDLALPGVTAEYQAQYQGSVLGRQSRQQRQITAVLNLRGLTLSTAQTVTLSFSNLSEVCGANVYRVTSRQPGEQDGALVVSVVLSEERSDTYTTPAFNAVSAASAVATLYEIPNAPTSLTATGQADGVGLAWVSPAATSYIGISIEAAASSLGPWTVVGQVNADNAFYGLTTGATVFFRVRAVNAQGQFSPYSNIVSAKAKTVSDGADVSTNGVLSLLANPNFEAGDTGWNKQTGWTIQNLPAQARRGSWVAVFSGGTSAMTNNTATPVVPGSTVIAQCYIKSTAGAGGQASIRATFYDASGAIVGTNRYGNQVGNVTAYTLSRIVVAVPETAASVLIDGTVLSGTGTYYFDDFTMAVQAQDQRASAPLATGGLRSRWVNQNISYTYDNASPANLTVSVTAAQLLIGDVSISYAALSQTIQFARGNTYTYYLFVSDIGYEGGSRFLYMTGDPAVPYQGSDRIYVGSIIVTIPAAASGGSGAGSSGGGSCVCVQSFTPDGRVFESLALDDLLALASETDLQPGEGAIAKIGTSVEHALRLVTSNGAALVCSLSAPIAVQGRGCIAAIDLVVGDAVGTLVDGEADWSPLVSIEGAGLRKVRPLNVGDRCFWAGETARACVLHHNLKNIP